MNLIIVVLSLSYELISGIIQYLEFLSIVKTIIFLKIPPLLI